MQEFYTLLRFGYSVFNLDNCTMIFSTKTDLRISAFLVLIEPFYFKIKGSHALFDKTFLNLRSNEQVNQKRRVKRFWHFAPETRPSTALHAHGP